MVVRGRYIASVLSAPRFITSAKQQVFGRAWSVFSRRWSGRPFWSTTLFRFCISKKISRLVKFFKYFSFSYNLLYRTTYRKWRFFVTIILCYNNIMTKQNFTAEEAKEIGGLRKSDVVVNFWIFKCHPVCAII